MRRLSVYGTVIIALCFSLQQVHAVIKTDTPLKAIESSMKYIFVAKVDKFFPDKPAMIVTVTEDIKGRSPFRQFPINCKVTNPEEAKANLIEPLLKRLGPDQDLVIFVAHARGKTFITFAYTNGTWFQLTGTQTGDEAQVVFGLKSAEPYYRKSFKGTTEELRKLLKDHAAGKATLPPIDSKTEPGLGPEYAPKQKSAARIRDVWFALGQARKMSATGTLSGVIPTLGIGAPLAILAMLFPAVFGGVFVLFRQWLAFISLISLHSTLMMLHWWLAPVYLRGTWWGTDAALWFLMTLCTLACLLWAWRRQLNFLYSAEAEAPERTEQLILLIMSAGCLVTTALMWFFTKPSWLDAGWALTVVMTFGVLAGAAYKFYRALSTFSAFAASCLATEGVILGAMLLGQLAFVPLIMGGSGATTGTVQGSALTQDNATTVSPVLKKWEFSVAEPGIFAASPLVDGDAIYAAYSQTTLKVATLVRLDRYTGEKKWEFIGGTEGDLVEMISSPCLADGKLYFGEGFHDDKNCRVWCVDAERGTEIWRFKTAGQTESSPTVAGGKVYIGAGNDGIYCLDAKSGKKLWRYPPENYSGRLLRFGAGACLSGDRLYCGTGVDRNQTTDKGEVALFCLDAHTGRLHWKTPAPFPIWSIPVVKDGALYVTSGNGDVFEDASAPEVPGGAVQCLDAASGQERWRFPVVNGIMEAPGVDAHRVYFGCRDGELYCIGRADGKERWRLSFGSPLVGTPALDCDPVLGRPVSVFAASSAGKISCVSPTTGQIIWTYDLTEQRAYIATAPRLAVAAVPEGFRRQLYFGLGLGGGIRDFAVNRPVFYCLEDLVKVE